MDESFDKTKNKVFSHSIIYLLSTIIQSGVQLLFIPYLTRALTLSQYGDVELFLTLNGLFNIIILFGINTKIFEDAKKYNNFTLKSDCNKYRQEKFGLLFYNAFLLILVSIIINMFYSFELSYLIYATITSSFTAFVVFELTLYQVRKQALSFLFTQFALSLVNVVVAILLISLFNQGSEGRYLSGLVSVASIFIFFIIKNRPIRFKLNIDRYFRHLILLLPLAGTSIFSWLTESIDKLMVNAILTTDDLAIYAVGYKFGMIILMITSAVSRAWMPYVIENDHNLANILKKMSLFSFGMVLITFIYILSVSFFYSKIVPNEYHEGISVAYIISIAYLLDGLCKLSNAIFIVKGKISIYVRITIFSGILNIILNALFIPEYGYVGSAYATLVSFGISFVISIILVYVIKTKARLI